MDSSLIPVDSSPIPVDSGLILLDSTGFHRNDWIPAEMCGAVKSTAFCQDY